MEASAVKSVRGPNKLNFLFEIDVSCDSITGPCPGSEDESKGEGNNHYYAML